MFLSTAIFIPAFAESKSDYFIKSVTVNKTVPDVYTEITSVEELNAVRDNLDGKYILMNDVDLSSVTDWEPIGNKDVPFTGVFNGNGYSVKNLSVKEADNKSIGLFGEIKDAAVANVYIDNINVKINHPYQGTYCVGAVAGVVNSSNILNFSASGSIDVTAGGTFYIGGIAGIVYNGNTISRCMNNGNIGVFL